MTESRSTRTVQPQGVSLPDARGRYGDYGGRFVPETLMAAIGELEEAYGGGPRRTPPSSRSWTPFCGPTPAVLLPLYYAAKLTRHAGGARIYLKREDLLHTGAHKINHAPGRSPPGVAHGQAAHHRRDGRGPARRRNGHRLRGAGHGVHHLHGHRGHGPARPSTSTAWSSLGATVQPVESGSRTLKDAINECMRDWVTNVRSTFYILGSVVGPHPYPMMVRNFQAVVGREAREQMLAECGRLPDTVVACVGGGSNAHGRLLRLHRRRRRPARRRGSRRPGPGDRPARGAPGGRPPRRAPRIPLLPHAGPRRTGC